MDNLCDCLLELLMEARPAAVEDEPRLGYARTLLRRGELNAALKAMQQLLTEDDAADVAELVGKTVRPAPLLRRVQRRQNVRQGLRQMGLVR